MHMIMLKFHTVQMLIHGAIAPFVTKFPFIQYSIERKNVSILDEQIELHEWIVAKRSIHAQKNKT